MDAAGATGVKRYFLVRWRKRRRLIPLIAIFGISSEFMARARHQPHGIRIAVFWLVFAVIGILFPFHWGGERGWNEKEWDG